MVSPRWALGPAALLVLGACAPESPGLAPMEVDQVVRDLLARPPEWDVRRAHPGQAPSVDVICPARRPELDGADMLSLVMPPPAEVRFRIDPEDAPATLHLRAGVDVSAVRQLGERVGEGEFLFEVRIDNETVHRSTVRIAGRLGRRGEEAEYAGSEWQDVGGAAGLEVEPGSVITLITRAQRPSGMPIEAEAVVRAGFGGLRLARRAVIARRRSSLEAPNVVLVVMDTLRRDRLSCYGYERETSPHLDRLAARGTLFEDAFAASSWTWPSTASIFTGLQPEEHGVRDSGSCFLGWELDSLAEALQRAGCTTAAWSANPLVSASRNFDQGFETFVDYPEMCRAGTFFPDVVRWLERWAGTRFFLYLHLTEPHRPFEPDAPGNALFAPDVPASMFERSREISTALEAGRGFTATGASRLEELVSAEERAQVSDLYDAAVYSGDFWLGRLIEELERLDLLDETIVVFTSDHGEELFEHGYLGHSLTVYGELVRAPLVLAGPGIPVGHRVRGPVSNTELAPLLAALAGERLGGRAFDPMAFLRGEGEPRPVLYSTDRGHWRGHLNTVIHGMRLGELSVQVGRDVGGWGEARPSAPQVRLFDLASDPAEQRDLASTDPERAARAKDELEARFAELLPRVERVEHSTGEGIQRMLERIGYAGH